MSANGSVHKRHRKISLADAQVEVGDFDNDVLPMIMVFI